MFPRAIRVATIGGVELRVDPSWLIIIVVLVLTYRSTFAVPGRTALASIGLATVTALLFAASILVHELGHALEGKHRGADVAGITLFALGGATALRGADRRARDEFAIAAIGPWTNIVLAAAAGLVATGADDVGLDAVAEVAGLLGWLNLALALFNLVPGAPLDGGRVLRAAVWGVTGDRHRATIIAAWAGIVLGLGLLAVAAVAALGGPGGLWGALWTAAIAAYVLRASIVERHRGRLGRWLSRHGAASMAPAATRVGLDATAGLALSVVDERIGGVLVDDGGAVGYLTGTELAEADPDVPIASLVRPLDDLPQVDPDAPADALSNLLDPAQPFVLLRPTTTGGTGTDRSTGSTDGGPVDAAVTDALDERTWLSSLRAIDQRIQESLRTEQAGSTR